MPLAEPGAPDICINNLRCRCENRSNGLPTVEVRASEGMATKIPSKGVAGMIRHGL